MSNIKYTVQDILQGIADIRGEATLDTSAFRIRCVSNAEKDFHSRKLWSFLLLPNQTQVGSDVADYTLGTASYLYRMKGLDEVYVTTTGETPNESNKYSIVDFNEYKRRYSQNNAEQMVYEWYDVANDLWKMHINPAPTSLQTITYSFYWEAPIRTQTTDPVICSDKRLLSCLAAGLVFDSEDEKENAVTYKTEGEQRITTMMGLDNSPSKNQLYSFGAIENNPRPRGIGSY